MAQHGQHIDRFFAVEVFETALALQINLQNVLGMGGTTRENHHLICQKHAFAQIMGDQQAGKGLFRAQIMHGAPQVFASEGIKRTKGFIQDQHIGLMDDRATQGGPLAHSP